MDKFLTTEELRHAVLQLRKIQLNKCADMKYGDGYDQALTDVLALLPDTTTLQLDDDNYLWKWVERALFDKTNPMRDSLSVIAHHPSAPWKKGRWEVDHKPYAQQFYREFPKAKGSDG